MSTERVKREIIGVAEVNEQTTISFPPVETWQGYREAVSHHVVLHQSRKSITAERLKDLSQDPILRAQIEGIDATMAAIRNELKVFEDRHPTLDPKRELDANFTMLKELRVEFVKAVMAQREEICRAFVSKYQIDPGECEQMVQTGPEGIRWFIRAKTVPTKSLDTETPKAVLDEVEND